MRIAVFLVFGLIVVLLAFASIVGAIAYLLVPGRARRTWFRSIVIGEVTGALGIRGA
jgi:uncharacterized membrane protein YeaQ/YmgE (transglycosylase-associated protein family)